MILGFLAYLSQSLSQAGYLPVPALTSQTALALLEELSNPTVDLLMVNLALPSTADLTAALMEKNKSLKVIAVEDPGLSAMTNIPVNASLRKRSQDESAAEESWVGTVSQVLGDK